MGVSIQGYLKDEVSIFSIESFIQGFFGSETEIYQDCRILFSKNEDGRYTKSIFVYIHETEDTNQHPTQHPIIVSMGGEKEDDQDLIKLIVNEFGGWFRYSDSYTEEKNMSTEYGDYYSSLNPDYKMSNDEKLKTFVAKEFGFKECNKITKLIEQAMYHGNLGGKLSEIDEFLENPYGK